MIFNRIRTSHEEEKILLTYKLIEQLGDPRATKALLQFLADTAVGCFGDENARAVTRARIDNERGLEELEAEERSGEG